MKSNNFAPKKNVAQAMVEFAIVLPLLLLLLYGLLEAGRLLFIYSSIVTASRQAVRYGATTGQGLDYSSEPRINGTGNGPNNSTILRYRDCYGIRRAAQKMDFLNAFDMEDITIQHDSGPGGPSPITFCTGDADTGAGAYTPTAGNKDRLIVTIKGDFNPIVPKIVPFIARTTAKGNPITATSARTLITEIVIVQTPVSSSSATTTTGLTFSPEPSEPNQTVVATATVSSSSGTPTGTVVFSIGGVSVCTATLSGGVATCNLVFNAQGNYSITATYNPDSASFTTSSQTATHQVTAQMSTTTTVTASPEPSLPGQSVTITATVTSTHGGPTPTGTVTISASAGGCNITLTNGTGSCSITFNSIGASTITATYNGDTTHLTSVGITTHIVSTTPATPSNTPAPPTAVPSATPTPIPPTPVSGCQSIRDSVGAIQVNKSTMSLMIKNTNDYPVTISTVYVAWNYATGHTPGDSSLYLQSAALNGNVFWTGSLNQPSASLPLSGTVVLPAKTNSTITFTFDKTYSTESGEQMQIFFSTPGCESYPVILPVGNPTITPAIPSTPTRTPTPTSTPTTVPSLKVQYLAQTTNTSSQQIQPYFKIINSGTSAVPLNELKIRYWYTREGTAGQTFNCDYASLTSSSNQCSYVTGSLVPLAVVRTGADFYLEISFSSSAGSIPAGGSTNAIQVRFNKSDWSNYTQTGDYSFDATKTSFADWTRVTLYRNDVLVWGTEP